MKKLIFLLILSFCLSSCKTIDSIPAAVVYTREPETTMVTTEIIESEIETVIEIETETAPESISVLINLNSGTFHIDLNCRHIKNMNEQNKFELTATIEELKSQGYKPCGTCSEIYKDQ